MKDLFQKIFLTFSYIRLDEKLQGIPSQTKKSNVLDELIDNVEPEQLYAAIVSHLNETYSKRDMEGFYNFLHELKHFNDNYFHTLNFSEVFNGLTSATSPEAVQEFVRFFPQFNFSERALFK